MASDALVNEFVDACASEDLHRNVYAFVPGTPAARHAAVARIVAAGRPIRVGDAPVPVLARVVVEALRDLLADNDEDDSVFGKNLGQVDFEGERFGREAARAIANGAPGAPITVHVKGSFEPVLTIRAGPEPGSWGGIVPVMHAGRLTGYFPKPTEYSFTREVGSFTVHFKDGLPSSDAAIQDHDGERRGLYRSASPHFLMHRGMVFFADGRAISSDMVVRPYMTITAVPARKLFGANPEVRVLVNGTLFDGSSDIRPGAEVVLAYGASGTTAGARRRRLAFV